MSAHFHEHHEAIWRWSWKLFCMKWVRLIHAMERQRDKEHEEQVAGEFDRLAEAHIQAHGG